MKKLNLLGIALLTAITLTACSNISVRKTSETAEISAENPKTEKDSDSLEVKDGPLTKVGQWTETEEFGKVTLKHIDTTVDPIQVEDGITIKIDSVKILHSTDVTNIFYFAQKKGEATYIQINASIANNSDNEYFNLFPSTFILSNGEQLDNSEALTLKNSIKPHATIQDSDTILYLGDKETTSLKLYYDSIFNATQNHSVNPVEFNIDFK